MKPYILVIVILCLNTSCFSQSATVRQNCDWYKSVEYRKEVDTIIVKGTFLDIGAESDDDKKILESLITAKKIRSPDVQYNINFNVVGCPEKVFGGSYTKGGKMISRLSGENGDKLYGKTMLLTCVFFEGYSKYDLPFYIITDVKFEK